MVQDRLHTEGRHAIRVRPPLRNTLVYRPLVGLLPGALYAMIRSRALRMSADGLTAAEVVRADGNRVRVVSSNAEAPLPNVPFDDAAKIIHATPYRVRVWGVHQGTRGVWSLSPDSAQLVAEFPNVGRYLATPLGDVPVSDASHGMALYLLGNALVHLPVGSEIVFGENGKPDAAVIPLNDRLDRQWALSYFGRDYEYGEHPAQHILHPLPFVGSSVRPFIANGRVQYLVRSSRGVHRHDLGYVERMCGPGDVDGHDVTAWSSPQNREVAILRRTGGQQRRLTVERERGSPVTAFEGRFFMEPDGFRWSPSGNEFVAHVKLVDAAGNQVNEQMLVTSRATIAVPRNAMAVEPRVDDHGNVAYVRVESTERADVSSRRLVVGSNASDLLPFVWNVSLVGGAAAANALIRGSIHRIEIPHGR